MTSRGLTAVKNKQERVWLSAAQRNWPGKTHQTLALTIPPTSCCQNSSAWRIRTSLSKCKTDLKNKNIFPSELFCCSYRLWSINFKRFTKAAGIKQSRLSRSLGWRIAKLLVWAMPADTPKQGYLFITSQWSWLAVNDRAAEELEQPKEPCIHIG